VLLALLAGLSPARGAVVDWTQAQLVTVTTLEYRFEPNRLGFRRDVPYDLRVVNRGSELHEFTAPAFFQAVEPGNSEALDSRHAELVVRPGETKDLYFIARAPGHFPLSCADHDWAGMTGEITIE
jgi:uncharacterized cupredoxin-like copper-binding protein